MKIISRERAIQEDKRKTWKNSTALQKSLQHDWKILRQKERERLFIEKFHGVTKKSTATADSKILRQKGGNVCSLKNSKAWQKSLLKEIYITVLIVCIIAYGLYHIRERISSTGILQMLLARRFLTLKEPPFAKCPSTKSTLQRKNS